MSRLITLFGLLLVVLLPVTAGAAYHHDLQVSVEAGVKQVTVVDSIELPAAGSYEFLLNQAFDIDKVEGGKVTARPRTPPPHEPAVTSHGFVLEQLFPQPPRATGAAGNRDDGGLRYEDYPAGVTIYRLQAQQSKVTLHYRARLKQLKSDKMGIVLASPQDASQPDGLFLDPGAVWYPLLGGSDGGLSFTMAVTVPEQWAAISQGARLSEVVEQGYKRVLWQELLPQQGIFLIAGRYVSYADEAKGTQSQVFLRQADDALAKDYLALTHQYVALYEKLIGGYPYSKFALVESFWESGFGMPSFTFLGPTVMRLPFIRTISYPHEIVHNWWGNSVYVDYSSGNWSEGLTSYLADYMLDEQRGNGVNHRREVLQKYSDFIRSDNDFALRQFTSSVETQGQAVGYGKSLMLFHMLRLKLGDEKFIEALRLFYQQYKFKVASYVDIERLFSRVYGQNLAPFFEQWVQRVGAPGLAIVETKREQLGSAWRVEGVLRQTQSGAPYLLDVPVAITLEGEATARYFTVAMGAKEQHFAFDLKAKPLRLDVDPEFDLFRRLTSEETPPALSQSLGAEHMLLVLAERATPDLKRAWRQLAKEWDVPIKSDSDLKQLPDDRAVWLLGWDNDLLGQVQTSFNDYGAIATPKLAMLAGEEFQAGRDSVVLAVHNPEHPEYTVVWFASSAAATVARYGQRLPHYRKYSYLAFDNEDKNVLKGQWTLATSPLNVMLEPGRAVKAVYPVRPNLVE